jgi:hypothetical protein
MDTRRYRLNLRDGGPGDIDEIILSDGGVARGPDLPNWQSSYLLGICEAPTSYRGDALHYVTLAPRYVGESLDHIRQSGGMVGVGRVLPGEIPRRRECLMRLKLNIGPLACSRFSSPKYD